MSQLWPAWVLYFPLEYPNCYFYTYVWLFTHLGSTHTLFLSCSHSALKHTCSSASCNSWPLIFIGRQLFWLMIEVQQMQIPVVMIHMWADLAEEVYIMVCLSFIITLSSVFFFFTCRVWLTQCMKVTWAWVQHPVWPPEFLWLALEAINSELLLLARVLPCPANSLTMTVFIYVSVRYCVLCLKMFLVCLRI